MTEHADDMVWFSDAFGRKLRAYVVSKGVAAVDVDDYVQETLARLHKRLRQGPIEPPGPQAYAFRIAHNLVVDRFRSRQGGEVELPPDLPHDAPSADDVVIAREAQAAFLTVLRAMPRMRREVFIRVRIQGQTHQEIAAALGLSRRAIEKHVSRALADLHGVRLELRAGAIPPAGARS